MRKLIGSLSLLTLCAANFAMASEDHEDSVTLYRVFVSDHAKSKITAFNVSQPEIRWVFNTTGQAKLYTVAEGSTIVAVQSDDDKVDFIHSGVDRYSHGDHSDIEISNPVVMKGSLQGPRPFHVIDHDGKISINFDKGGYAAVLEKDELKHSEVDAIRVAQNRAHHGVVVPWGKEWLSSVAEEKSEEDNPPRVGIQTVNIKGQAIDKLQICTGLHGEAFSGSYLTVGCKEGVLAIKQNSDGTQYKMLPYPKNYPKGETTGTLIGAKAFQIFLGNVGSKGLSIIDPEEAPYMRYIELPFRRIAFILDPIKITNGYVLTEDGSLHQVNLLSGKIEKSKKVTKPYSMDGHWNDPRPRLAMAGEEILITDPDAGLVRRINTESLSEVGSINIGGMPYNITVAGGSGLSH